MAPKKTRKETHVGTETLENNEKTVSIGEIFTENTQGVTLLAEADITTDAIALEQFMNEILTVYIVESQDEEVNEIQTPNVNGMNQPIVLGQEMKIKRKYVEAMARTRTTVYKQVTPDPTQPDYILMQERTVVTQPFSVLHDPSGVRGREWLKAILAQK